MRTLTASLAVCIAFALPTLAQPLPATVSSLGQVEKNIGHDVSFENLVADLSSVRGTLSEEFTLARKITEAWVNEEWRDAGRSVYTYDDGLLVEQVEQELDGSAWNGIRRTLYNYSSGTLSETVRQRREGSIWVNLSRVVYVAVNDTLEDRTEQVWTGSGWVNSARIVISFDASGNRSSAFYETWNGSAWENAVRYSFTYNAEGGLTELVAETWTGSSWVIALREVGGYDAGLLVDVLGQNWRGEGWVDAYRVLYTYDGYLNRTVAVEQAFVDSNWVNRFRTRYEYDLATTNEQEGTMPSALSLSVYPNPAHLGTTLGFELERAGAVEWSAYDVTGRRVATVAPRTFSVGAHTVAWDLGVLPAGVYVIRLRTEDVVATRRLVVVK